MTDTSKTAKAIKRWYHSPSQPHHLTGNVLLNNIMSPFLGAKAECFVRLCHRLGVCLSVRPSVTLVICIKTVQARVTKSSLWAAPRSLVYRDKISCHWVQGFPSNESVKEGYPLQRRHFAVIGSNNVKTVADRSIHAAYHNKHWWQAFWIYQHRWPW